LIYHVDTADFLGIIEYIDLQIYRDSYRITEITREYPMLDDSAYWPRRSSSQPIIKYVGLYCGENKVPFTNHVVHSKARGRRMFDKIFGDIFFQYKIDDFILVEIQLVLF